MVNWKRGFRRLGWVATALAAPIVAILAYDASQHRVGYRPRLLTSDFPTPGDTQRRVVRVDNLGIFYFPRYLSEPEVEEQMRSAFPKAAALQLPKSGGRQSIHDFAATIRAKYPRAYDDLDPVDLTWRVLAKYPEYRSTVDFREYEVEPIDEKRPLWAAAVTFGVVGALALLIQAAISIVAWVARGFSGSA